MRIGVLGTLVVDGATPNLREATMLAALALRPGLPVAAATLADAYWGEALPATWPKQVQGAISRLRAVLGRAGITTANDGYALAMPSDELDTEAFATAIGAARRLAGAGDPVGASDEFRRALELWRGRPFSELSDWGPAQAEVARLDDLRLGAEEDLVTTMIELGDHRGAATLAERLVAEAPYREERWAGLALAAYRSGRQADALAALRAARQRLREDLGVEPGHRLVEVEQAILDHSPWLQSTGHDAEEPECPYRGLRSLGLEDARWFHGRESVVADTLMTLNRAGVVVLVGSSGSGKSSVALAGVAATMRGRGWNIDVLNPSDFERQGSSADRVLALPSPLLVVLDQFEELFASADPAGPESEIAILVGRLLARGDRAIVTVRSEFLDAVAALPVVGGLLAQNIRAVGPMTAAELRVAIEEPARVAQLRLEPGLSAVVLRDASGSPTPLPLLSHALAEAWRSRTDAVLRVRDYEQVGGIAGAIAASAERLYSALSPQERRDCRTLLERLVSQDRDGIVLRRRIDVSDAAESPAEQRVLARLIRARLVTVQDGRALLTHEAILTAWPRLRSWVSDAQEAMRVLSRLSAAAEEWDAGGRDDADLYRGPRLDAAAHSAHDATSRLTSLDRAFLAASEARADAEALATVAQRRAEARQRRRLITALVTTIALFAVSVVTTSTAVVGSVDAARSADSARASGLDASIEALLARSIALRASERDVGALIAAEMWRRWPDDQRSRAALMSVFTASGGLIETTYLGGEDPVGTVLPESRSALLVDDAGMRVRDLETGDDGPVVSLGIPSGASLGELEVSADGSTAAVVSESGVGARRTIALTAFHPGEDDQPATVVDLAGNPADVAVSVDGTLVAVAYEDGLAVTVIDAASGGTRTTAPFDPDATAPEFTPPGAITFLPSGALAVGTTATELIVLDPITLEVESRIGVPARAANVDGIVAGDQLVVSGDYGVTAVDWRSGEVVWQRPNDPPKPTTCARLAASVDTGLFYCADGAGRIAERSLNDGLATARRFDPQLGTTGSIGVYDAGRQLVSFGGSTATISRWSTDGGGAVTRLIAEGDAAYDGYGEGGRALLVANRPPSARIDFDMTDFSVWDAAADQPLMQLAGANTGVAWAGPALLLGLLAAAGDEPAFASASDGAIRDTPAPADAERGWLSPDGARHYLALNSGVVETLDGGTGRSIGPTFEAGGPVVWVAASPDASRVVITRVLDGVTNTGVFDARTGELLVAGLKGVKLTAVGSDGSLYAATNGRISVHDLQTLAAEGTIPGARGEISSLQIDRDGRMMLVTANDDTASLVDLDSGVRLGDAIPAYAPLIIQGFLRPDGREAVVNIEQGIQQWDLDPQHQFEAACRIAGRELTDDEWSAYMGFLDRSADTCAGILP